MSKLKAALDVIGEKVQKLTNDYREELETAWLKKDDKEDLTISYQAKFALDKGNNICVVSISFTPEKVSDRTRFGWDDKQQKLFETSDEKPPRGRRKK
jgi:S-adenosylmethionine synthetase